MMIPRYEMTSDGLRYAGEVEDGGLMEQMKQKMIADGAVKHGPHPNPLVLVERPKGWFHNVDTVTHVAMFSMDIEAFRNIYGREPKPVRHPFPIHTHMGTLG